MGIKKGILKSFNAAEYSADIQITGSAKAYLEDVTVAKNIPSAEMQTGRNVAVIFWNEFNAQEAVVVAVYD